MLLGVVIITVVITIIVVIINNTLGVLLMPLRVLKVMTVGV